ncbi:MAG: glycosyltransferase [Actinobacteria bacterium]|nr:glycosyltransferase [Actinomycetota bacterium]
MTEISVIVPVYRCADCLRALHARLIASLDPLDVPYEVILIDDGSPDASGEAAVELARRDARVRAVRHGRNFGEEAAIRTGLSRSTGRFAVVMDCDLQDAPEDVPRLYAKALEGNEVVLTHRHRTGDSRWRVAASRAYHALVGLINHRPIDPEVGNFSIVSRRVAERAMASPRRQYRLVLQTHDVPRTTMEVQRLRRYAGSSSYNALRLVRHSVAGLAAELQARRAGAGSMVGDADGAAGAPARERYHQTLARVERDHWWLVTLREVVAASLARAAPHGGRVLDIGCSTGHLLASIPSHYDRVGVEVVPEAVALARERHPGIEFVNVRAEALPFPTAAFDAVVTTDVLSDGGVDDWLAAREARRVLRPGGTLIVHVAAYEQLLSGHDRAVGTGRRYRRETLAELLEGAGFRVERVSYRVSALLLPAALHRLLSRRSSRGDVDEVRPWLNRALTAMMRAENAFVLRRDLPFGLSVLAVARAHPGAGGELDGRSAVGEMGEIHRVEDDVSAHDDGHHAEQAAASNGGQRQEPRQVPLP